MPNNMLFIRHFFSPLHPRLSRWTYVTAPFLSAKGYMLLPFIPNNGILFHSSWDFFLPLLHADLSCWTYGRTHFFSRKTVRCYPLCMIICFFTDFDFSWDFFAAFPNYAMLSRRTYAIAHFLSIKNYTLLPFATFRACYSVPLSRWTFFCRRPPPARRQG